MTHNPSSPWASYAKSRHAQRPQGETRPGPSGLSLCPGTKVALLAELVGLYGAHKNMGGTRAPAHIFMDPLDDCPGGLGGLGGLFSNLVWGVVSSRELL